MHSNPTIFAGLTETDLTAIQVAPLKRSYPKNVILMNQGDQADTFYVILSGAIKVFRTNQDGREVMLRRLGPGDYFGELVILDALNHTRSASVMTIEKSTMYCFSKANFQRMREYYPEVILQSCINTLVKNVRSLTEHVESLALENVYGRLLYSFHELSARTTDTHLIIQPKLTQREFSSHVGASREMVARILKDLENLGYIHYQKDEMWVKRKLPKDY